MRRITDLGVDPTGPGAQFVRGKRIVEAEHPFQVVGGREVGREAGAPDQLRGRVGRAQLRVLLLERLEASQQRVELGIGDDRCVAHVVAELVFADLVGQLAPLPQHVGRSHPGRLSKRTDTIEIAVAVVIRRPTTAMTAISVPVVVLSPRRTPAVGPPRRPIGATTR